MICIIENCFAQWRRPWLARAAMFFVLVLPMSACQDLAIATTNDPYAKLSLSEQLLNSGRVMQARGQVDEATAIFEQHHDKAGLALAYREYAQVALFGGLNADPVVTVLNPEAPPTPTSEELDRSDEYLKRALPLATETKQLHIVANINYFLALNQVRRGTPQKACPYYDLALDGFVEAEAKEQVSEVEGVPQGVKNRAEFLKENIEQEKKEAGCPSG